ncbi:MAG: 1,4-alpha-glucan branching protein domain-containing protein [Candidatus Margulisiibacteriota bacterium]
MEKGYLALVLHAHLPFVRHPEHSDFLEEDWLFEAITETYIPLINVFDGLIRDGIPFKITVSLSPTLIAMLRDDLLQQRYIAHMNSLIELSYKEIERTKWEPQFNHLAHMYKDKFENARWVFCEKYGRDLTRAFKTFLDSGCVEVITCGATHGFLPLMETCKEASRAQIRVAARYFKDVFGRTPAGIWLPECGYFPGHDRYVFEEGIRYFFVDTHGILHGSPRPKYGIFAPVYCRSGAAAFGRDIESSKAVWSAKEGYPGDYNYREFYRDIGFDLDFEYMKPYIHSDGIRVNTGIKYYRITGETNHKEPYDRRWALDRAADHAGNFMFNRQKQVEHLYDLLGKKPILVSPYDAELFGHWWFEGPEWLDFLIRKLACDQDTIKLTTPSHYLDENKRNQVIEPSMSSWGYKGYNEVWLEGSNDWIYRHLHKAAERMMELANDAVRSNNNSPQKIRALNQAARELLLAQASDWAFIMKTGTTVPYAVKRTKDHIERFTKLYEMLKSGNIDEGYLADIGSKDNLFPDLDYRVYCT